MSAEVGRFVLWWALLFTLVNSVLPLWGLHRRRAAWVALAPQLTWTSTVLVGVSFVALTIAFVSNDFSVLYVSNHSNSKLPLAYRIAGVWGGHEGSLLLWLLMLQGWSVAVARWGRHLPTDVYTRTLVVMSWVAVGFMLFILTTSDPFERVWPVPPDGRDLNPLLQDPGMVFHPPLLYMGYVGFSVAFAFAIAALLGGQLTAQWARWTRPWTTAAWMFLTIGIALGSWWAYYELGWGGWWFWDPVENASFMPWLIGTALIHSLAVTEKRGAFKSWTILLAILAFSLSLLGTFLVRSGVLSSVHAFATDPRRGLFILGFLAVVVGGALALYAWRAPKIGLGGRFEQVSKETFLLANNLLLLVACSSVLLGTLYPLVLDGLGLGKISVGVPYFESVFAPLMAPLLFLMSIGPLSRWKEQAVAPLATRLRWALLTSVATGALLSALSGTWHWSSALGYALAAWIVWGVLLDLVHHITPPGGDWRRVLAGWGQRSIPLALWGMWLAHLGVAVFVLGVVTVKHAETDSDVKVRPGDTTELAGYRFEFLGVQTVNGPNYKAQQGVVRVTRGEQRVAILHPEKRHYLVQTNPMTEAAIHSRPTRDLYVALGEDLGDGTWTMRVYLKPLVTWIWGGCGLMALGGLLALSDRRYRRAPEHKPLADNATDHTAVQAMARP
ncbi:MAG: hypothetical protein RJA09_1897 [Pseudomonadota bacterium]